MTEIALAESAWEGVDPGAEALVDDWLVQEGQRVDAGQVVARVVLVKATIDVTAPAAGTIEKILVTAEQTFARGTALAVLREG